MIRNNIRLAIRLLFKHKSISIINTIGLSVSLACALFILLWVQHELIFDRFHPDYEQIYRVEENQFYSNPEPYHVNVTPNPAGPVWKAEVPEIMEQCRIAWSSGINVAREDNNYFENDAIAVDSSFFDMFGFTLLEGDKKEVLNNPQSIVLAKSTAKKYFPTENPIGQTLKINNDLYFTVTGIMSDPPKNSVIPAKILLSWDYREGQRYYSDSWNNNAIYTYVKTIANIPDSIINAKITEVTDLHKEGNTIDFVLNPIHRIHLHSYFGYGKSAGAVLYVRILIIVALFILLIACINFMNMSTAKSSLRAMEIGLRKMNGATKSRLARQYLSETIVQTFTAIIVSFIIVLVLLNKFNDLTGKDITAGDLFHPEYLLGIIGIGLITGIMAGMYPALYLASFSPMKAIREQAAAKSGNGFLRKVLVVFQFSLAVLLIAGTMIIKRQVMYIQQADLGFDKDHLINISLRGGAAAHFETMKREYQKNPSISEISASMDVAQHIGSNSANISWPGKDEENEVLVNFTGVAYDYTKSMGIEIIEGRGFSSEYQGDMYHDDTVANFLINQTLADIIQKDPVVGTHLNFMGVEGNIVGVMEDYHFSTLHTDISPLAIIPMPDEYLANMIVRIKTESLKSAIASMEQTWKSLVTEYPFEYSFVDEEINKMYQSEQRLSNILGMFTFVAIVISLLGLFALSSFLAERKTREIGIRKTYGASDRSIVKMMMSEITVLIIISLIIGLPTLYFIAGKWLDNFAYRIDIKADIFLLASLILVLISVLTVLYQAIRSSRLNPITALHYE